MESITFTISCKKRVGQVDVEYSVQRQIPQGLFCRGITTDLVENISKQMEASLNRLTEENV